MTDQQKNTIAGNSLNAVEQEPVRLGTSIQKHAGSKGTAPVRGTGWGARPPFKKISTNNFLTYFAKKENVLKKIVSESSGRYAKKSRQKKCLKIFPTYFFSLLFFSS